MTLLHSMPYVFTEEPSILQLGQSMTYRDALPAVLTNFFHIFIFSEILLPPLHGHQPHRHHHPRIQIQHNQTYHTQAKLNL